MGTGQQEQEQTFSHIYSSLDLFIQKFNACLEINSSEWNQLGMRSDLWFLVNFLSAPRYYLRLTFYASGFSSEDKSDWAWSFQWDLTEGQRCRDNSVLLTLDSPRSWFHPGPVCCISWLHRLRPPLECWCQSRRWWLTWKSQSKMLILCVCGVAIQSSINQYWANLTGHYLGEKCCIDVAIK